jgi:hypothetical protein
LPTVPMNVLVPAIAALAGALIGSLAPIVVGIMQSQAEQRRERMRLATQLAIEDNRVAMQRAQLQPGRHSIPPLSLYVLYHADMLELLSTGRAVTPEDVRRVRERSRAVMDATEESQAEDPKSPQRPR